MFGRVRHFNNTGEYSCQIALIRLTFLFLECNEIPLVWQDTIRSSSSSKSSFCTTKSSDSSLTTINLSSAILTEEPVEFRATRARSSERVPLSPENGLHYAKVAPTGFFIQMVRTLRLALLVHLWMGIYVMPIL